MLDSQSQELGLSPGEGWEGLAEAPLTGAQKPPPVLVPMRPALHPALGLSEHLLRPCQDLPLGLYLRHPVFGSQNPAALSLPPHRPVLLVIRLQAVDDIY